MSRFDRAHLELLGVALRLRVAPWVTNDTGRRIYVDPGDKRAWRMARGGGALDRDAVAAWRRLVTWLEPDLVLDIGANYGEVLLAADYPGASVHAFEPNPRVAPRLARSMRRLGTVHEVAVSSSDGTATLGMRRTSSGVSSLERRGGVSVEVATVRIDRLGLRGDRLLFKLDVEGHEPAALAGMAGLLWSTPHWVGLVEHVGVRDMGTFPRCYRIRRSDTGFEEIDPSALQDEAPAGMTKDVVISSESLPSVSHRS